MAEGKLASAQAEDLLAEAAGWRDAGHKVALATVVQTWGSSPRPVGSQLIVDDSLRLQGSVSGGCIEGAVVHEAQAIMDGARPKLLEFGVSDEQAWDVGLACGGTIKVFVERVE
ncbi:MAG: XdhC family protein [Kiloniellaceae bacterium]